MSDLQSGNESGAERGGEPGLDDGRRQPSRPRLVAFGFLLALAATVLTVILTGLMLRG